MSDDRNMASDFEGGLAQGQPTIDVDDVRRNWGWMLAFGVALLLGGIAAMVLPFAASLAVSLAVGVSLAICGVLQGVHAFQANGWKARGWSLINALLYIGGAIMLLLNPLAGMVALTVVMIAIIGSSGILRLMIAFRMRPEKGWGWILASGMVAVGLAGLMLSLFPQISMSALGIYVGITLVFEGWAFVFVALAARPES